MIIQTPENGFSSNPKTSMNCGVGIIERCLLYRRVIIEKPLCHGKACL